MASDWIKMRVCLWTHPKVVTILSQLSVTRAQTIGALFCAWCIADQHADENGVVQMKPDALDLLCEMPGLSAAMASVQWLKIGDGSLQFLSYQEHNGTTGKQRADASKRQRASRKRHKNVTDSCDKSVTREEKRREEKKDSPNGESKSPLSPPGGNEPKAKPAKSQPSIEAVEFPPGFDTADVRASLAEWLDYKTKRREFYADAKQLTKQLKIFAGHGPPEVFIDSVNFSIANDYQGIILNERRKREIAVSPGKRHDPSAGTRDSGHGVW